MEINMSEEIKYNRRRFLNLVNHPSNLREAAVIDRREIPDAVKQS